MAPMERAQIEHLAKLARLELSDEEITKYQKEMTAILGYVEQLDAIADDSGAGADVYSVRNVMREDDSVTEPGTYTEVLVGLAPASHDGFIQVQKILDTNHGA